MKNSSVQEFSSVLDSLIQNLGIRTKLEQYSIFELWAETVGEQIARVTAPERIENGVLIVRVSAAPWRTELVFRKKEVLEKIHAAMKSQVITDIRFR